MALDVHDPPEILAESPDLRPPPKKKPLMLMVATSTPRNETMVETTASVGICTGFQGFLGNHNLFGTLNGVPGITAKLGKGPHAPTMHQANMEKDNQSLKNSTKTRVAHSPYMSHIATTPIPFESSIRRCLEFSGDRNVAKAALEIHSAPHACGASANLEYMQHMALNAQPQVSRAS